MSYFTRQHFGRRIVLVAGAIGLSAVLVACGSDSPKLKDTTTTTPTTESTTTTEFTTTTTSSSTTTTTAAAPSTTSTTRKAAAPPPTKVVTYHFSVATRGKTTANVDQFGSKTLSTLSDSRGWSLNGQIKFQKVDSGGDFVLWLSAPDQMTSFDATCSAVYSCRVGKNVIINDDRWTQGSPTLKISVDSYRDMVINHEVGHWLGLGHSTCPGAGQPANVMQQQSKGGDFLGACTANAWPRTSERQSVARIKGLSADGL